MQDCDAGAHKTLWSGWGVFLYCTM